MIKHWIVIADANKADIYATDELLNEPKVAAHLTVQHGKVHVTDAGGNHTEHLPGGEHGTQQDPHKKDEDRFARAVAHTLDDAFKRHAFERAVIAAPPVFLGDLRRYLDKHTAGAVVASIPHDWTHEKGAKLFDRVKANLPHDAGM